MMLLENLDLIAIVCTLVIAAILFGLKFAKKPTGEQRELILNWLSETVVIAEKRFGSKTGQIKIAYVWNLFTIRFPSLKKFITQKQFEKLVDEALESVKGTIEDIKNKQSK